MEEEYNSEAFHPGSSPNNTSSDISNGTQEIPEYIFIYVTAFNAIIFVTGILGNVAVIFVILRLKHMRTCMNYLLMSLSIADLLVLSICQTSALLEFYGQDRWLIGELMCKVVPALENAAAQSSVLALIVISCERYFAVCNPLKHKAKCSGQSVLKTICIIWITAFILSIPFAIMSSLEEATFIDGTSVHVCRTQIIQLWHYIYIFAIHISFFGIPCVVMIVMYSLITMKLRAFHARQKQCSSSGFRSYTSRRQTIIMLISVVILFFICLTPMRIISLWVVFASKDSVERLGHCTMTNLIWVGRILMYTNSACNPIIYGLISTKFRNAFKKSVVYCESKSSHTSSCTRNRSDINSYALAVNGVRNDRAANKRILCINEESATNRRSTL